MGRSPLASKRPAEGRTREQGQQDVRAGFAAGRYIYIYIFDICVYVYLHQAEDNLFVSLYKSTTLLLSVK